VDGRDEGFIGVVDKFLSFLSGGKDHGVEEQFEGSIGFLKESRTVDVVEVGGKVEG
jgi:hypothetical protein